MDRDEFNLCVDDVEHQFIHDPHFCYPDCFRRACECDLVIARRPDGSHVIVATERPTNTGMSVTNAIEYIAEKVRMEFSAILGDEDFTFVEHYDHRSYAGGRDLDETWDVVKFESDNPFRTPSWRRLTKEEFEQLLGSETAVRLYNEAI